MELSNWPPHVAERAHLRTAGDRCANTHFRMNNLKPYDILLLGQVVGHLVHNLNHLDPLYIFELNLISEAGRAYRPIKSFSIFFYI